ncbi:hypothetical protein BVC93_00685 [Mycobacterium sp. MS1601]|uniref:hypothetical protein n=1 Tax=Mycobacterium sp. MS1601 TaxID=1936029 RepID=UPI0009795708|nr:hypothetical protein [Mycobacterium sp. MS1601]AQA01179.1 hypothetical protein BVC93_00685 [Mycobacterium sp. MS1601]
MSVTENVVFRTLSEESKDVGSISSAARSPRPLLEPSISYRSIPGRCVGVASTLAEARVSYRAELTELLNLDRHELPPVVEHVEAKVAGMWVRSKVGAVHRDRLTDRMFLQRLLESGDVQDEIRTYVSGVEAVVVLAEPEDPVATVLDQMAPDDAVVVTFPDDRAGLGWTAIHGPRAAGPDGLPVAHVASGLRACPIEAFAATCIAENHQRAVRLEPRALAEAS